MYLIELLGKFKYLLNINSFFFFLIEYRCNRLRFFSGYLKFYDKKKKGLKYVYKL